MSDDPISRIRLLADQCVMCGLCLPHCPTYAVDRVEGESPRGRIALARALADGQLDPKEPANWTGLDHCLGCRRCETVCPAKVEYGALLVEARRLQRRQLPPAGRQRLLEWLTMRPRLLAALLGSLRPLRALLPPAWRRRLPTIPAAAAVVGEHPAHGSPRGTVALFLGCVARRLDLPVHLAAIRVLTRLGWNVRVPPAQTCCGALHRHAGAAASERALQQQNAAAFSLDRLDAVIVSASGCFDSLRRSLADSGPPLHELLAFIAADPQLPTLALCPQPIRVALHTPCTQASAVQAADAAAAVLGRIPQLELIAVSGEGCCGAAGNHMLVHPDRAARLRGPLLDQAEASAAGSLCSANIGCRLHLQAGFAERGSRLPARHPIELLSEALP
jgi:glycolate oxidase iron-sulfur subunit